MIGNLALWMFPVLLVVIFIGVPVAFALMSVALIFGVMGFIPALVLSAGVYWVVRVLSRLPMQLTPGLVGFVFGLSLAMCVVSCVLALGKVRRADPADLF